MECGPDGVGAHREPIRGRGPQTEGHVCEPGRTSEQPAALSVGASQGRREQSSNDAPRICLLEFAPPAREHTDLVIRGAATCEIEQDALADAGWTLDDNDTACAGADGLQAVAQFGELAVSLDEPRGAKSPSGAGLC